MCYMTNNSRKNELMVPVQKQHPVLDVTGNGSKSDVIKNRNLKVHESR